MLLPRSPSVERFTIDDPVVAAMLADQLDDEPFAFLGFAAATMAFHGLATPPLVRDLIRCGRREGAAMAAAFWWLSRLRPPAVFLDVGLPPWLVGLDRRFLRSARRRNEGRDGAIASHLVEVELVDGRLGTVHAQTDRRLGGAVVHAFAADASLVETIGLFDAADRWRVGPQRLHRAAPFEPVRATASAGELADGLRAVDRVDVPLNLHSPWPGIRPLVELVVATDVS